MEKEASHQQLTLDSPECKKLVSLIKDSFRVRKNHRPLYVDVGGNLDRLSSDQHQVIFGRRGSGKSCLLVHYFTTAKPKDLFPVYVLADEYKRLTYPDILIRFLIEIMDGLPIRWKWLKLATGRRIATREHVRALRRLLDMADESDVVQDREQRSGTSARASLGAKGVGETEVAATDDIRLGRQSKFRERKIDTLERHLRDYKSAIDETLQQWPSNRGCVLIDDFYLVPRQSQPDVLDYLHRLLRDTELYLKVATIRHRTTLLKNHPHTIGVELSQDVEEINLDRTLEDVEATEDYLRQMLELIGRKAGINNVSELFNPDGLSALTRTSGGVPRDFLTILVNAIDASTNDGKTRWLTPTYIYKGAGRLTYQTKLRNLREDANGDSDGLDRLLVDLLQFCLREKKKTAFLISQDDAQQHSREHELIQQLMDFKLIHVVEPDTSAASGRTGRYEAYTLDFSLFMEPRRRDIDLVEFWKIDENRRREGLREAPVYSLERAGQVFDNVGLKVNPEALIKEDEEAAERANRSQPQPAQDSLF